MAKILKYLIFDFYSHLILDLVFVILLWNDAAKPTLQQYYILFHWAVVGFYQFFDQ